MRWKAIAVVTAVALACWLLGTAPVSVTAADPDTSADEQLLKAAKIGTDNAALLDFFRNRTVSEEDRASIEKLIALLGDNSFKVRQKASADLVVLGSAAVHL